VTVSCFSRRVESGVLLLSNVQARGRGERRRKVESEEEEREKGALCFELERTKASEGDPALPSFVLSSTWLSTISRGRTPGEDDAGKGNFAKVERKNDSVHFSFPTTAGESFAFASHRGNDFQVRAIEVKDGGRRSIERSSIANRSCEFRFPLRHQR